MNENKITVKYNRKNNNKKKNKEHLAIEHLCTAKGISHEGDIFMMRN